VAEDTLLQTISCLYWFHKPTQARQLTVRSGSLGSLELLKAGESRRLPFIIVKKLYTVLCTL
jgi:hypothetical protein